MPFLLVQKIRLSYSKKKIHLFSILNALRALSKRLVKISNLKTDLINLFYSYKKNNNYAFRNLFKFVYLLEMFYVDM